MREKCPYLEFFGSVFSCIRTEYGEIRSISYSVRMQENTDQKNPETDTFPTVDIVDFSTITPEILIQVRLNLLS